MLRAIKLGILILLFVGSASVILLSQQQSSVLLGQATEGSECTGDTDCYNGPCFYGTCEPPPPDLPDQPGVCIGMTNMEDTECICDYPEYYKGTPEYDDMCNVMEYMCYSCDKASGECYEETRADGCLAGETESLQACTEGCAGPNEEPEDQCPDDPSKTKPGECGCGTPDTDSDGDGALDCNDKCPSDPDKTEFGACGCGTPDCSTADGSETICCDPNSPDENTCLHGFIGLPGEPDTKESVSCVEGCKEDADCIDPSDDPNDCYFAYCEKYHLLEGTPNYCRLRKACPDAGDVCVMDVNSSVVNPKWICEECYDYSDGCGGGGVGGTNSGETGGNTGGNNGGISGLVGGGISGDGGDDGGDNGGSGSAASKKVVYSAAWSTASTQSFSFSFPFSTVSTSSAPASSQGSSEGSSDDASTSNGGSSADHKSSASTFSIPNISTPSSVSSSAISSSPSSSSVFSLSLSSTSSVFSLGSSSTPSGDGVSSSSSSSASSFFYDIGLSSLASSQQVAVGTSSSSAEPTVLSDNDKSSSSFVPGGDDDDDGDGDNDDGIIGNQDDDDDGDGDNDDGIPGNQVDDTVSSLSSVRSAFSQPRLVAAAAVCGDGELDSPEECDDNNRRDNDGCSSACLLEVGICGDGRVQKLLGEQCEQATHSPTLPYACIRCQFVSPTCGNGTTDPGEECDDGTQNSTTPDAHCRPNCRLGSCGDAILDTSEQCDDGNRLSGDGCDRNCRKEAGAVTQIAADQNQPMTIGFNQPFSTSFPNQAGTQQIPYQLPLAQLQPLVQGTAPVGDTGPAAVAVIGAGAAAGWSFIRRRKK